MVSTAVIPTSCDTESPCCLPQTHPDDALVVNQTVAMALLSQELGPFDPRAAQRGTKALLAWALNSTSEEEWLSYVPAPGHGTVTQQPAGSGGFQDQDAEWGALNDADEDSQERGDGFGLDFGLEQPGLLDEFFQVRLGLSKTQKRCFT